MKTKYLMVRVVRLLFAFHTSAVWFQHARGDMGPMPYRLTLYFQLVFVCGNECADVIRQCEEPVPLFSIQGYRKPAKTIHRDAAFIADFQAEALGGGLSESAIFGPKPYDFFEPTRR